MIYLIVAIILGLLSFYFDFLKKKSGRRSFYILAWILLVLLAGLRYKVGGDTYNYMAEYDGLPDLSSLSLFKDVAVYGREPGWILVVAISKLFSDNFTSLQILLALLVNTTFFWFIKKQTRYYFTGILIYYLLFYCYMNFEILRASLAVCVFMLAFNSLINKKYKTYYLYVVLAIFFHISAVCLIFFPLLLKSANKVSLRYDRRSLVFRLLFIAILIFASGLFLRPVFEKILPFVGFNSIFHTKIRQYNSYDFTVFGILSSFFYYIIVPLFFINRLGKRYLHKEFLAMMIVYVLIASLITYYSIFFRMLNYLTPCYIIVITEYLFVIYNKKHNYSRNFGTVCIALSFVFVVFTNRYLARTKEYPSIRWYVHWYPYNSVFNKKVDRDREKLFQYQFYN